MLKDVTSIKLTGANFKTPTMMNFFTHTESKNKVRITLLYGRNGAGKSTIAKAFKHITNKEISSISYSEFMDESGNIITLSEEEKNRIFVFDEEYVDKNVKVTDHHFKWWFHYAPPGRIRTVPPKAASNMD